MHEDRMRREYILLWLQQPPSPRSVNNMASKVACKWRSGCQLIQMELVMARFGSVGSNWVWAQSGTSGFGQEMGKQQENRRKSRNNDVGELCTKYPDSNEAEKIQKWFQE